ASVGDVAGLSALTTEDFKETNNFTGWTIGIGIELLPWMPNEDGRPYLVGQKNAVSNGQAINDYAGYTLSNAYADSVTYAPTSAGIRYRNTNDSLWVKLSTASGAGYIPNHFSGLSKGDYWVQAFSQAGDRLTYGDMTQMSLSTLHFDANGASGSMNDTLLVVGDSIVFPPCTFTNNGKLHAEWNTKADGSGTAFSPKGEFAIAYSDSTLFAQWRFPFATDDYFDGIVGGSRVELDVVLNDTLGNAFSGEMFPIEIINAGTSGTVTIEGNKVIYSPSLTFSGPDFFTYLVDYNGAVDTAQVVILVFDAPGNMVNADCFVDMPKYEWEVYYAGESPNNDISPWTTPLVGDLFGDEYPEIVAKDGSGWSTWTKSRVYVYNGSATPLQSGSSNFNVTTFNTAATTMAIAKVTTTSGLRSTLFIAGTDRRLYAYNPQSGAEIWRSSDNNAAYYCEELGNNEGAFIGVADFNNDNQQEVYAGNRIYNAETGALLCSGADTTDIGHFVYGSTSSEDYSNPSHHMMHSVTGDFNRDGDLELAAGRYVFDVDIAGGTMPILAYLPDSLSSDSNMIKDGITVIADVDIDGDLDVIVAHQTTREDIYCYVWDGQTPTLMAEKHIHNEFVDATRYAVGVPFIGDLNGDGKPEIAFTTSNRQYAFSYSDTSINLQEYYTLAHTDRSGFTGLTLFDFNNDDIAEIVYRDETDLRIINASGISHLTGNDTLNGDGTPILYDLATYSCSSSTQSEFAVVADVDLDDQAEIVVTNNSRLNIFESGANSQWVGARPVWNQYGYNVTNVNNDLTIPTYAINNSMAIEIDSFTTVRPFNHFLQQMGNVTLTGENVILTADLFVSNSFYTNDGTTGTLTLDIVNQGDIDFAQEDSTVSFYCGDPDAGGLLLGVSAISADIAWDDTLKNQIFTFPADPTTCPRIYVRLNDNGNAIFPDSLHIQQECNYENNKMLAAIFAVTSHFTWNGYDLDSVVVNSSDTSAVNGIVTMLISRGDTMDVLPELAAYIFKPTASSLPHYNIHNDTITLDNVQENGTVNFTAYKIPEVTFIPKSAEYDKNQHSGIVNVTAGVVSETYYRNSTDTAWTLESPDSVGYYAMKVVTQGNYLYTAYADSIDSILVITPRPVSFDLSVDDKPYDGSDSVVSFTVVNDVLSGDILTLDVANSDLHFSGTDAGTYQVFPSGGWAVSGQDARNYVIQAYDTVSATITKHWLSISANDSLKLYDGGVFYGGNGITCTGFALGEDTSVLVGNLNYNDTASAQGALEKGVYAISIDGFSSHNYDIVFNDGALIVEKRYLLIEFGQSDVMTYGDSIDLLHYTLANVVNLAPGDTFIHQELGFWGGISTTGNLQTGVHTLNLGDAYVQNQWGDTVTSNYDVSFSPEHITVLPKEVYIVNAVAQNKIYDANADAAISGAILSGVIDGDVVGLNNFSVGQFIQTDVGTTIEVFHSNAIDIQGLDANNYILIPFSTALYANISPKELTLSGTVAEGKMYDADSVAEVRGALLNGVIGADNVFLQDDTTGVFEQANVGTNLNVKTDITINGSKSHNYYLTQTLDLLADITPLPIIISAVDSTKSYDAQPFLGGNGITWSGFVSGEDTTDLSGELSFSGNAQMAVDTGHDQIKPQGFSASNYTITYVPGFLTVNPRVIHIDYNGQDTVVYGSTVDKLDYNPSIPDLALGDTFIVDFIGFDNDTSSSGHLNVGARVLTNGDAHILNAAQDT
ncbi:MAG: YDG domain-containing protein, partial [Bacteroidales bacterium]|nr:YDG domain-containing protein [Bacteroidales bacterium]